MQQLIVTSSSWVSKVTPSGVQRLLDDRAKQGSWMPSRITSIRSAKFRLLQFLTTYFQSFTYIFPVPKVSHDFFLVIYQHFSPFSHQFVRFTKIRSLDAPQCCIIPWQQHFLFFVIYLHFSQKKCPLGCPQSGCPGPSHRPHPPLHATAKNRNANTCMMHEN